MKKLSLILFLTMQAFTVAFAQADTVINQRFNYLENSENLTSVISKLKVVKSNPDSNMVVVHFGDSHIQGDFLTGTIRQDLQTVFGNGGEGILFPYSICKSYGPKSLKTDTTGVWTYANVLKNPTKYKIGVTGYTLVSKDKKATISFNYNPVTEVGYDKNEIYEKVIIWHAEKNLRLLLTNNEAADGIYFDSTHNVNGLYQTIITNYHVGTELKLQFDTLGTDTIFNFHGITFENSSIKGMQYNRCGVVGATFLSLVDQQDFTISQLKELKPDLIIFSYGSNESYNTGLNIEEYAKKILAFTKRIKKEFPNAGIIFTNTPDTRSRNRFPKNTQPINEKLRKIAVETGSAYWDLNKIMGGNNSMLYWLSNGLAGKDKLHFTKTGYALQGNLFSMAFLQLYNINSANSIQTECDSLQAKINLQLSFLHTNVPSANIHSPTTTTTTTNSNSSGNTQIHYVKQNDTLSGIAKKYGVTVKKLCAWNNLTEKSVLHINQKIVIKK